MPSQLSNCDRAFSPVADCLPPLLAQGFLPCKEVPSCSHLLLKKLSVLRQGCMYSPAPCTTKSMTRLGTAMPMPRQISPSPPKSRRDQAVANDLVLQKLGLRLHGSIRRSILVLMYFLFLPLHHDLHHLHNLAIAHHHLAVQGL